MTEETQTKKEGGFFYGWWIVIGGLLIMATCYTIFVNCLPLFQAHIVEDLNVTVAQYNTGTSLTTIVAMFASLVIGKLVDKMSAKTLGAVSVITSAVVLFCLSMIQNIWQFYICCIVAGMIVVSGTRLLISVVVSNWFDAKRSLAVSIALCGSGVGGVVLSPTVSAIIASTGWRMAFVVLAIITLVVALPIVLIKFHSYPSDVGLEPYGAGQVEEEGPDTSPDKPVTVEIGLGRVVKNAGFWMVVIGFVAMGLVNGAVLGNSVSNMTSMTVNGVEHVTGGHSTTWAGNVWSFYLAVVIFAKVGLGAIYDKWGMAVGTIAGTVASCIACICLMFPATNWGPILACGFFGFATCMGTVAPPVMVTKEFGMKDLGTITGIVTAFEMLGAAVGSIVSGLIFDAYFTFAPAWIMCLIASIVMGVTLLASIPLARKLVEKVEAEQEA